MWAHCIGALAYAAASGVQDSPANIHGAAGTVTHAIADALGKGVPHYALGTCVTQDGFEIVVEQERIDRAAYYVEQVRACAGPTGLVMWEERLDMSKAYGVSDQFGTGDATVAVLETHTLQSHDLKDGNGIVSAQDNDQLISYLLATWDAYDYLDEFTTFEGYIWQPRANWKDKVTYTREQMDAHRARLTAAAQDNLHMLGLAQTPLYVQNYIIPKLNPGPKQCQWCPMRGTCVARARVMFDIVPDVKVPASQLSPEDIGKYLQLQAEIDAWFAGLRGAALALAIQGTTIPGFKLITGKQGNRAWSGDLKEIEEQLYEVLEDKAYNKKMISPTDAQKKLMAKKSTDAAKLLWTNLQANITRAPGQIVLAAEADGRAPVSLDMPEFGIVDEATDLLTG